MNIAIDARWIYPEISGIGAYTREVIRALVRLDHANAYTIFFNRLDVLNRTVDDTGMAAAPNFTPAMLPFGVFSPWNQVLLPGMLRRRHIDCFHSTNYMVPILAFPRRTPHAVKCVVTIHDVIPLAIPDQVARSKKARLFPLFRRLMLEVGARADIILTDSQASRLDIIRLMHVSDPSKVRCVYCGVSERLSPNRRLARPAGDSRRPRELLYVGRADPYKNLVTLVQALPDIRQSCPFPVTLTVAGSPDPRYPEAQEAAQRLGLEGAISWTGYLSDEALANLYARADVLVHPSRYEGFGLQVAEAMASGLPVVCSNATSLPEVVGDAALTVDPMDIQGLARATAEVLTQEALAGDLSEKGKRRAARFTWLETARQIRQAYEDSQHA